MSKDDSQVMVVPKRFLDPNFEGFAAADQQFLQRINEHKMFMRRGDAEHDSNFKQIVTYVMVIKDKKLFGYQRASKKELAHEERLHSKWSIGVGGHIEKSDANDLTDCLFRELEEEIGVNASDFWYPPKCLGYINSEVNAVAQVHFGVLYVVAVNRPISFTNSEISQSGFYTLEEAKALPNLEEWSQIAVKVAEELKLFE